MICKRENKGKCNILSIEAYEKRKGGHYLFRPTNIWHFFVISYKEQAKSMVIARKNNQMSNHLLLIPKFTNINDK